MLDHFFIVFILFYIMLYMISLAKAKGKNGFNVVNDENEYLNKYLAESLCGHTKVFV